MLHEPLKGARLVALFLAGIVLFNYPFLSLFNLDRTLWDVPLLFWYLFGAWLLIILAMVRITDRRSRRVDTGAEDTEVYRD